MKNKFQKLILLCLLIIFNSKILAMENGSGASAQSCPCGKKRRSSQIRCITCGTWRHTTCLGLPSRIRKSKIDSLAEDFMCDRCKENPDINCISGQQRNLTCRIQKKQLDELEFICSKCRSLDEYSLEGTNELCLVCSEIITGPLRFLCKQCYTEVYDLPTDIS